MNKVQKRGEEGGTALAALPFLDCALRKVLGWLDRDTEQCFMNHRLGGHIPEAWPTKSELAPPFILRGPDPTLCSFVS